jgi:hypothetical protein
MPQIICDELCVSGFCSNNETCCDDKCVGGCEEDEPTKCIACKDFSFNGTCVDKCPKGMLEVNLCNNFQITEKFNSQKTKVESTIFS